MRERHLPSNLLDNVADEGGALAQVTLGARDTGLDDAGGGFLHFGNRPIISFKVHHPRPPREDGSAEILHEVRLGFSTYVALVDADNQARTGSCFLGHVDGWLWVVVDGGMVRSLRGGNLATAKSFRTSASGCGVGADARPEGGLPDCGEGVANGERAVLALPGVPPTQPPPRKGVTWNNPNP